MKKCLTFIDFFWFVFAHDHPHRLEAAQEPVEPPRRVHSGHRHRHSVRHLGIWKQKLSNYLNIICTLDEYKLFGKIQKTCFLMVPSLRSRHPKVSGSWLFFVNFPVSFYHSNIYWIWQFDQTNKTDKSRELKLFHKREHLLSFWFFKLSNFK